ncbi:MAG: exopolyphosphatase [Desulfobacterales bacterium]|jgi:oligoribonuclease NrnB/cAMP/cGMP phosphodiesterase (DHH superfamily)|nr:exopolyphosphatase [Desulfobacterales bacterium]
MRIVTRADFDGVVCAALLYEAENITHPIYWVEPSDMQHGRIQLHSEDIIANLPYVEGCALWFDHHITNEPNRPVNGLFKMAPSAAGIVYEFYKERLTTDFTELIRHADDIDSANLTREQVRHPENDPYLLLSMTISSRIKADEPYWNKLVQLLRGKKIDRIMADSEVKTRCEQTIAQNLRFKDLLRKHTHLHGQVAVSDFRSFEKSPDGNRFLVYSLFPESMVAVKIRYAIEDSEKVIVSVGRSIFNPGCRVNVGQMLSQFGGGGHAGAGAASFHKRHSDTYIPEIIDILMKNE